MKVIPPNFGYVEEGIFRCGAPEPRHYGFLASLGLHTCILLTDIHDDAFVHWLQESGVTIFCPLVSESQTRGNALRGAAPVYRAAAVPETGTSGGAPDRRPRGVAGGGAVPIGNGKEDKATGGLASSNLEGTRVFTGANSVENVSVVDADGTPDGFTDERTSGGVGGDRYGGALRGWPGGVGAGSGAPAAAAAAGAGVAVGASPASSPGVAGATLSAGTSNAARFLQENVADRQVSSKFSPVFIPEPLYFPANGAHFGGGMGSGGSYDAAVPSYEGKLHGLMTLSEAVVVSILHLLLDPQYYPLLITCSKGRYRSGIVCGCLRKLQGWNLVSILEEYRRFAGNKSRADNEEFIELFDEELVSLELSDGRRPTILYNA